ncbi:MAG: OsmC family protein [Gemmatimonadota bacterium]
MLGTLNGVLEVRGIQLDPEEVTAEVEGFTRVRDRLPVLTEILVHYRLRIPPGTRDVVDQALARHASRCPSAASLRGAVEVGWTAQIEERDA